MRCLDIRGKVSVRANNPMGRVLVWMMMCMVAVRGDAKDAYRLAQRADQLLTQDLRDANGFIHRDEIVTLFRNAIDIEPRSKIAMFAHVSMANLFVEEGSAKRALAEIEESFEIASSTGWGAGSMQANALYVRGKAFDYLGMVGDAHRAYHESRSITQEIGDAPRFAMLTWVLKYYTEDDIQTMQAMLSQENHPLYLSPSDKMSRSYIHFGLSRAYHARDLHGMFWDNVEMGNMLRREALKVDGSVIAKHQVLLQTMKASFPSRMFRKDSTHRESAASAIFVVGVPRSGSTLVEQILSSHSKVWGAGENTLLSPLLPLVFKGLKQNPQENLSVFSKYGNRYKILMEARMKNLEPQKSTWVDKMLHNLWYLGVIRLMVPDACFIRVARDPMDAGFSIYKSSFEGDLGWTWDLSDIGAYQVLVEEMLLHWRKVLPGEILEINYEDLVSDHIGNSVKMLEHCGLQYEPSVAEFYSNPREVRTASMGQVRSGIYNTSIGTHKKYMDRLEPLKKALGAMFSHMVDVGDSHGHMEL